MKPRNHDLGCMVTGTHLFQHKRRRFAGDLLDKYNRRRSAAWYWRQVLIGIVNSCASQVRHHRRLATQGIVIILAAGYRALLQGGWLVVEFFMHCARQPGLVFWVICVLGALVSMLLNKEGSLQQNLIFGVIYYLVAVPRFTIGGFFFTRVPKTPRH